jgi:DNA ligase (NAD+)
MDIETKIQDLRKKLNDHNYHYYVLNDPIISDSEYDELLRLLQDIEQKNPNLVTDDSPTQRVGAPPLDSFESVEHRIPMLSLENAMDSDELIFF